MKTVVCVIINLVVGDKQLFLRASGTVGTEWIFNVRT